MQRLQLEEAYRLKGFLDAGQVRMPGADGVGANSAFAPGTGAAAGTNPDNTVSGSSAGNAPGAVSQGTGGERDAWEKWKGLDPESQEIIGRPVWPVNGRINSPYGYRVDPKTKQPGDMHHGLDIKNDLGGDVVASRRGVVTSVTPTTGKENQVVIKYDNGSEGAYMHTTPSVEVGQRVWPGAKIGVTDMSGKSTGARLHYQYKDKARGGVVDPIDYLPKR